MHHETEDFAEEKMPVPKTITVTAKYGADLREVWPAARVEEKLAKMWIIDENWWKAVQMVSWATTKGKYCRDGMPDTASSHPGEPTIMGIYTTMDAEVIADPAAPETVHHLAAYWYYSDGLSYYCNNHCYELPGLKDPENIEGAVTIGLYNDSAELRDTLYLVPADTAAITKFGFADLMKVSYHSGTGEIIYGAEDGGYYAVRGYQKTAGGETKYYAVARRVNTVSSNRISVQNPSSRQHMKRANNNPDHTNRYQDHNGQTWGDNPTWVGAEDDPYDLYFYYDRDLYTITYKAASVASAEDNELGHIDLPFGAYVSEEDYSFRLLYTDTNRQTVEDGEGTAKPKYLWTYPQGTAEAVPVCPDRNPDGSAVWTFKGWGLGPAGVNMQWTMPDAAGTQSQASADFYIQSDMLLYAIWEAPLLTVTFHLNGGSVSGGTEDTITVSIPANTRYSEAGHIPRPSRNGYALENWYLADESGTPLTGENDGKTPFDFDSPVIENLHVAAAWTAATDEKYKYTVYYVTDKLNQDDTAHTETVRIDGTGSIVETGGTAYYLLEKAEQPEQVYVPNLVLNLTAKLQPGYTPKETNKTLEITGQGEDYKVIFYYEPQINGSYTVKFVKAGTEAQGTPKEILTIPAAKADQIVVTPGSAAAETLAQKGYRFVNRSEQGTKPAYTPVEHYTDLTWIDKDGRVNEVSTLLPGTEAPETIIYLVQPIAYSITYECAADSPAGAADALAAVTSAAGTAAEDAQGKNPTQYTSEDAFTLGNPGMIIAGTDRYRFSHWSLGTGTTVKPGTEGGTEFETLTVDEGTTGHLTFIANWEKMPAGSLTVSKTVEGALGNRQKDFSFTITLSDKTVSGVHGDMTFTGGKASFTLKHGEEKTALNLPAGVTYEVTETQDANYDTAAVGDRGTITAKTAALAAFTNTRKEAPPTGIRGGMPAGRAVAGLFTAFIGVCACVLCSARRRRGRER